MALKQKFMQLEILFRRLRKGIIPMMSANVLNNVINMLSNMIITRILSKAEYGIWGCTLNIYSYLNLITGLGLLGGAFQFGVENRGSEKEFRYYKYCLYVGLGINTIITIITLGITIIIPMSLPAATPFIRAIAPIIIFEYIFQLLLTVLRCQNRIKEYALLLNCNTIMLALGHCAGALAGVWGVVAGRYLAVILSVGLACVKTKRELCQINNSRLFRHKEMKGLWHYSIFLGACSALNWLLYLLDVSMIASLLRDPEKVALYKVGTLIPSALVFIPTSVVVCILPQVIQNRGNHLWLRNYICKVYLGVGSINLFVCALLFLFAPYVITIISGKQYLETVPVFRVLICGYFVLGTFRILSTNILASMRYVNYNLFLSIISGLCDVIFNYCLIKKYGMIGAAYATLGVDIVASILAFGFLLWKMGKRRKNI